MTVDKYEPVYPFRAESFKIVKNPADANDWSINQEEDVFYGNGFVTGPDVPAPKCANEEFWHNGMTVGKYMYAPWIPLYLLKQCSNFNKPIC